MAFLRKSLFRCKICLHNFRWSTRYRAYCSKNNEEKWEPHVVTGIQPTGSLHVGHYFGVINKCVELQNSGQKVTIFIADLHSLTTTQDPALLRARIVAAAAALAASGVRLSADDEGTTLFAQSAAPAHAELCWALACVGTQARLEQLPQFRERAADSAHVPLGLLLYPVLQAADILAQRGTAVVAGRDQAPHIQLAGALARAFRSRYGAVFPAPRLLLPAAGADRLLSLRNPARKMAKSDPNRKACVLLTDSDDQVRLKIRKAVTDFTPEVTFDPERRPGVSNLVTLHCLAAGKLPEEAVEEARGLTTAQYKELVAAALVERLRPLRERAAELRAEPAPLLAALAAGAERARARAAATYADAARSMGVAVGGLP